MNRLTINILTVGGAVVVSALVLLLARWIVRRVIRSALAVRREKPIQAGLVGLDQNVRLLFGLAIGLTALAVAGAGGYLIWKGHDLPAFLLQLLDRIPRAFQIGLAISLAKLVGVALALVLALRLARRLLRYLGERAKAHEGVKVNAEAFDRFFGALQRMLGRVGWLGFIALALKLLGASEAVFELTLLVLRVYLILAVGIAVWRGLDALIELANALSERYSSPKNLLRYYSRLSHLLPLLHRSVEYTLYALVGYLITLELKLHDLAVWGPRIIKIIGILLLGRVAVELGRLLAEEILLSAKVLSDDQRQRRLTMLPLIRSAIAYGVYFAAGIMILKQLGINPVPVLAGAGIVGLAVGFGAQNLINDIVSGFFIIFENTYLVGDVIKSGDAEGTVEAIGLRTTRIRDGGGRLHIVRNGRIQDVINYSKEFTFAVMEVGISYDTDLQKVFQLLKQVGQDVQASSPDVLEPMVVRGVKAFGDAEVLVRTTTKVRPGKHSAVEFALRRAVQEAFAKNDIEWPRQHIVVTSQPTAVKSSAAISCRQDP